ncbi:MAG: hypothetical protein PHS65_01635 [Arcobacteraceae bacterium]|nr:hypothetical protein [Arcobacteraceae bacterium]
MSNLIDEFIKNNPPKFKLRKYENDISMLLQEGYTQSEILRYLAEYQNVKVGRATLSRQIAHLKKTNKTRVSETKNESFKQQKAGAYTPPNKISEKEFLERVKKL